MCILSCDHNIVVLTFKKCKNNLITHTKWCDCTD